MEPLFSIKKSSLAPNNRLVGVKKKEGLHGNKLFNLTKKK